MDINALFKVSYGIYIVSSINKTGQYCGFIGNAFTQVNSEPPTFALIVNKKNFSHTFIEESGLFSVSILSEDAPLPFIGTFGFKSGRDFDKFQNTHVKTGIKGLPIVLDYSVAYLTCEVFKTVDMGSHTIFIANLIDTDVLENKPPMTYLYYRDIKKGTTGKNAPTYITKEKMDKNQEEKKMAKYVCDVCGYVYDPAAGDPDAGIKPGTSFENLPENWVCPVCAAGKDQFSKE